MAATQLPLKVRTGIRDVFESTAGPIAATCAKFKEEVGIDAQPQIDWRALWSGLEKAYERRLDDFVPGVADTFLATLGAIQLCCEDDEWGDEFLENVKQTGRSVVNIFVLVDSNPARSSPSPSWSSAVRGFELRLSPHPNVELRGITAHSLTSKLITVFKQFRAQVESESLPQPNLHQQQPQHDGFGSALSLGNAASNGSNVFPTLSSIPPPELVLNTAPYYCKVHESGWEVRVQCSHARTLQTIAEYLEQYARHGSRSYANESRSVVFELVQSHYGGSGNNDTLVIRKQPSEVQRAKGISSLAKGAGDTSDQPVPPNTLLVLALLQNVFGYETVKIASGTHHLIRKAPFQYS